MKKNTILKTERLILRRAVTKDANELARFFSRNRKFHNRPDRPDSYYTPAFWKKQIAREAKDFRSDRAIRFYLFLKSRPSEVIGMAAFDNIIRGFFQSCTLGYLLGEDFEGQGFMTEALQGAIRYVFTEGNLHRISAGHVLGNKKSCRVLTKAGFLAMGIEPKYLRINGRWQDHELHVLINRNWKSPQTSRARA